MPEIIRLTDPDTVAEEAARRWAQIAQQAVEEHGTFSIALAGGSTPKRLYQLLATDEWQARLPWGNTHVFFGDERRVPPSHEESNYRMAREALLDHVPIPAEQVNPMDGTGLIKGAMRDYESKLRRYFDHGRREFPRFDLVLLGMGSDGHTASIFPGTRAVSDLTNTVLVYPVPQLHVDRMTLTLPVINNARNIIFMVVGDSKAETLAAVLEGPANTSTYPSQAVRPNDGTLVWLLDQAAASKLTS